MKILVYVPRSLGGVRNVTLGLADGFRFRGHEVVVCESLLQCVRHAWGRSIDLAVLSLASGVLALLFSQCIYILHGFAAVDAHSFFVRRMLSFIPRFVRCVGGKLVAVSYLTKSVHERILGIPVDGVIFNGVSKEFFDMAQSFSPESKSKVILFVGRFIPGKKVLESGAAFLQSGLQDQGYRMQFIGAGPLLPNLQAMAKQHKAIEIFVDVEEPVKVEMMRRAEIFLSLNDFEPMGVVFAEALVCGCKIVAPICGGHREFIPLNYPLVTCDPSNEQSIIEAMRKASTVSAEVQDFDFSCFSYREHIAQQYLALVNSPD